MANPENKQIPYESTQKDIRDAIESVAMAIGGIAIPSADHVSYDNSGSGLSAADVQNALDEIVSDIPTVNDGTLTIQQNGETKGTFTANQTGNSTVNIEIPTTDIQTAVDEFETYNGGLLSECKVTLEPVQDLHGYDSPWVGGAGKNKLPLVLADIKTDNTAGTWSGNKYTNNGVEWEIVTDEDGNVTEIVANNLATGNSVLYVKRKPQLEENTNYILNGCPANGSNSTYRMAYSNQVNQDYSDTGNGVTFQKFDYVTYPNSAVFCVVYNGYTANNIKFKPMARLATESDPTFEPYSNICPISGHTQVKVQVKDSAEVVQNEVTQSLGTTVYHGTDDVVSGKLTDDGKKVVCVLDGTEGFSKSSTYQGSFYRNWNYFNPTGKVNGQFKCSHAKFVTLASGEYAYGKCTSDNSVNLWLGQPEWTVTDFHNYLATQYANGTPVTIEYEVNSPTETETQLTPSIIETLVGENHLSAPLDGQEITESKYKQMFTFDDVIAYIQSLS